MQKITTIPQFGYCTILLPWYLLFFVLIGHTGSYTNSLLSSLNQNVLFLEEENLGEELSDYSERLCWKTTYKEIHQKRNKLNSFFDYYLTTNC